MEISAEEFARGYRNNSAQEWNSIPAVITGYDRSTEKATVRPLIKQVMRDRSTREYASITSVPVWTPRTAFAALKLPVQVGDKVLLVFSQRSLDETLFTDLSDLKIPDTIDPKDNRLKSYNDCVALAGFNDFNSAIGTTDSVTLINNWKKGSENSVELKADGSVEVKNSSATITVDAQGKVTIQATEVSIDATKASFTCPVEAPNFLTPTVDLNLHTHTSASTGSPTSPPIPS